jgi:type IV secretion system protein VirB9
MKFSKILHHQSFVQCLRTMITIAASVLVMVITTASQPISTDSRIKTYIYNPNDVYRMVIHYGFQSHIEFGAQEEVETISVGDTYAWQITPVGRRLFIKPLEENIHTNLTVITNKRAYQFEIIASSPDDVDNPLLAYVVRFYYPETPKRNNSAIDAEFHKDTSLNLE